MSKFQKPDFICVSPHKTGTTWLYEVLKAHSQVWLPPKKELWVLNQLDASYLERWRNFYRRRGMPGDNYRYFEADLRKRFKRNILDRQDWIALLWWFKFLCLPYNFRTYPWLFSGNSNLVCGDITPNYYFLKPNVIARLAEYNRNTRLILIMREPVERVWSYTRMTISADLQKPLDEISHLEFRSYFDQIHSWWKPYIISIALWTKYFQNVYVGYYDLLQEDPQAFYREICDFLCIESILPANVRHIINRGTVELLPNSLRLYLNQQYLNEIRELAKQMNGSYPKKWLQKIESEMP